MEEEASSSISLLHVSLSQQLVELDASITKARIRRSEILLGRAELRMESLPNQRQYDFVASNLLIEALSVAATTDNNNLTTQVYVNNISSRAYIHLDTMAKHLKSRIEHEVRASRLQLESVARDCVEHVVLQSKNNNFSHHNQEHRWNEFFQRQLTRLFHYLRLSRILARRRNSSSNNNNNNNSSSSSSSSSVSSPPKKVAHKRLLEGENLQSYLHAIHTGLTILLRTAADATTTTPSSSPGYEEHLHQIFVRVRKF